MKEIQETWVSSLGQEDPLEEEMATHSNILAWKILQSKACPQCMGSQRVRHDWASERDHSQIMFFWQQSDTIIALPLRHIGMCMLGPPVCLVFLSSRLDLLFLGGEGLSVTAACSLSGDPWVLTGWRASEWLCWGSQERFPAGPGSWRMSRHWQVGDGADKPKNRPGWVQELA